MICPVEIASDMSAFRAVVGDHARHELLHTSRHGAGDESTGSDVAGDGDEDHVVASGRDPGHQRPAHAALAGAHEEFGFRGLFDPRRGRPSVKRVPVARVERLLGLYREHYFDMNVRHFREAGPGAFSATAG